MYVKYELDLNSFEAWSGAETTLDRIIDEDKTELLEQILEDIYPDGMEETELNDLLRFESETVFEWLGMETEEQIEERENEAKQELSDAQDEDNFTDFCACFRDCEHCPLSRVMGECESNYQNYIKEE